MKADSPLAKSEGKDATEAKTTRVREKSKSEDDEGGESDANPEENLLDEGDPTGELVEEEAKGYGKYGRNWLDRRRKNASLRLNQSKAYSELVEARILDLEKKVRSLRNEKTPPPDDRLTNFPSNRVGVEYQSWEQFSERLQLKTDDKTPWKHRPEIDLEPKYIIEVLQEAPSTKSSIMIKNQGHSDALTYETVTGKTTEIIAAEPPHQIRIRSRLLLKTIQEATKCNTIVGPHKHRLLLFRPYKLFVKHAGDLQNFLDKSEREDAGNAGNGA